MSGRWVDRLRDGFADLRVPVPDPEAVWDALDELGDRVHDAVVMLREALRSPSTARFYEGDVIEVVDGGGDPAQVRVTAAAARRLEFYRLPRVTVTPVDDEPEPEPGPRPETPATLFGMPVRTDPAMPPWMVGFDPGGVVPVGPPTRLYQMSPPSSYARPAVPTAGRVRAVAAARAAAAPVELQALGRVQSFLRRARLERVCQAPDPMVAARMSAEQQRQGLVKRRLAAAELARQQRAAGLRSVLAADTLAALRMQSPSAVLSPMVHDHLMRNHLRNGPTSY